MLLEHDLKRFAVVIFFLALALRLFVAWRAGFFHQFEQDEMVRIALSLVRNHEYGNPFFVHTGPTAHEMPLYPLFLSVIYLVFGIGSVAEAVKIVLACVVVALRCALVPLFCVAADLGRRVAIAAGILGSIYISALQTELRGNWDGPWQALVMLILIGMTIRIWSEQSWLKRTPWLYFVVWGLAILLQPAFLPILAAFMLAGLMASCRVVRDRYLKQCIAMLLMITTFLVPWVIRNYLQLGSLVLTRDNFGLEFWLSNGPGRAFDVQTNLGYAVPHPSADLREARLVLQSGEIAYNREKLNQAEAWVRANPRDFAQITAVRALAFWFRPGRNNIHHLLNIAFSVLALTGLGLLFRAQRLAAALFGLTWLSFPIVYYIIQWSSKYRYPIEWELLICACLTINSVLNFCLSQQRRSKNSTPQ